MIHWEYIKGLNQTNGGAADIYSFLNFQNTETSSYTFLSTPTIIISPQNDKNATGKADFGHIITELAEKQRIKRDFIFNNHVSFHTDGDTAPNYGDEKLNIYQNYIYRLYDNITDPNNPSYVDYIQFTTNQIELKTETFKVEADIDNTNSTAGHKITTNEIEVKAQGGKDGICTAVYFNATSDKRAKTDFSLLDINALDLVKKVQLYSFKYKDSNLPSIGIIAQDVQDVNIKGFKLVDNENATGQDFDYMTIHESKLTYILWKAVQELSKEVEDLKKQLNK